MYLLFARLGQIIKPNVIKLPAITKLPTITSSDTVQDHALPYPTINEKDLRRANKEGRPLVLGRGQSGVVRLMRYHQSDGSSSLVAVKRLISGTSSGTQVALMREIRAMLDVEQCPIFPRVVGVINKQSFAQEYIGNPKSLASLSITKALRGRPQIALLNWILIITDVVEGLSALHQSGWAHCDIQTNNVLLWKNWGRKEAITRWEARIIDLGNAKWLESSRCLSLSLTEKETYYRNCRHIPAEVVEGQAPYSIASDIHSLGVLMTDIASKITSLTAILPLAESCTTIDYKLRPSTQLFMKDLDTWCYDQTGCNISQLKRQIITYVWRIQYCCQPYSLFVSAGSMWPGGAFVWAKLIKIWSLHDNHLVLPVYLCMHHFLNSTTTNSFKNLYEPFCFQTTSRSLIFFSKGSEFYIVMNAIF